MGSLGGFELVELDWRGDEVSLKAARVAAKVLGIQMAIVSNKAKGSLRPGRGLDTGAMKKSIHVAEEGYPWASDNVPAGAGAPERGGHMPDLSSIDDKGYIVIEVGSGQDYSIYYHQDHYPFLRIPFDAQMKGLRGAIEFAWAQEFK